MQATFDVTIADGEATGIDAEKLVDALADPRRRRALGALRDRDDPVDLSKLAADVCRRGGDDGVGDAERRRTAVSLHHRHLPRLDDLGVVSYDAEERSVALDVDVDAFEVQTAQTA